MGEIEEVLTQHEQVKEAVVTLYEADSKQTLAAYVTIEAKKLSINLRDYLKNRLPDYMQPTSFTMLDKLPLTVGKIDRQALPEPSINLRLHPDGHLQRVGLGNNPAASEQLQLLVKGGCWKTAILETGEFGVDYFARCASTFPRIVARIEKLY